MKTLVGAVFAITGFSAFFLFFAPRTIILQSKSVEVSSRNNSSQIVGLPSIPEASPLSSGSTTLRSASADIENQWRLSDPPEIVKALYATGWSAGSREKMTSLINIIESRGLNAIVIDIKDYSGYVSYAMNIPEVKNSGAENEIRILRPNELIKRLHDKNIYVIGRVTVFQDPILAAAHPEWALRNKTTGKAWKDKNGLAWLDPAGKGARDYAISIAKDALGRGFDEINFDYIRFASDGDLSAIEYPFWDEKTPRRVVIRNFFAYLREQLPGAKLSADLFGLATIDVWDDLGIGQVIEDAYQYFDYVSPMVYPSHYGTGFMGYKSPAKYPYEVVKYSMERALDRLMANGKEQMASSSLTNTSSEPLAISNTPFRAKLRPWLQAFDLGAVYTKDMIQKQIKATEDALASSSDKYAGWFLWDPTNNYKNFK